MIQSISSNTNKTFPKPNTVYIFLCVHYLSTICQLAIGWIIESTMQLTQASNISEEAMYLGGGGGGGGVQ